MRKHYVGMDVHQASTSMAVMNGQGKVISETLIETKAQTIIDFLKGLRGEVHATFEEGTQAAWLYDLIRPHVTKLVVCNPHHNHLLKSGNKSDRVDARKLAQLLREFPFASVRTVLEQLGVDLAAAEPVASQRQR